VATLPPTRCPGCGVFLPGMPDPEDYGDDERAYHHDVDDRWQLHDCPALEQLGPRRADVQRAPRRERPRRTAAKQRAYLRACQPPRILRAATDDLTDLECPRCSRYFIWSPTPSELGDDELAGRVPA
jgi:hypothetical protein